MAEKSVPATRELRGIRLFEERGDEIIHEGHGVYTVPGCSGGAYRVDLAVFGGEESCSCPDFSRHHKPCKHIYFATIHRAKARMAARREAAKRRVRRGAASRELLAGGVGA